MPGDTISFNNIEVENTGDDAIYVLANIRFTITKTNEASYIINEWYNLNNQHIDATNLSSNNVPATLLNKDATTSLNFSYTFDGNFFDNTFQSAKVGTKLFIHAIQPYLPEYNGITSKPLIATQLLVEDYNVPTNNTVVDYTDFTTNETVTATTPSESYAPTTSQQFKLYNFTIENVSESDTMYVYVTDADLVCISPGNLDLTTFLIDYQLFNYTCFLPYNLLMIRAMAPSPVTLQAVPKLSMAM